MNNINEICYNWSNNNFKDGNWIKKISMTWNKTMFLLPFLLLRTHSFSQELQTDSPYLVNYKTSTGKLLTYGDTLTCGVKIILSKDKLESVEPYSNGSKNGLSFYYKKGKLKSFRYYYNGLSDTLPNPDFQTHKIELHPPSNYGNWEFQAINSMNDKVCLVMDSGKHLGKKTVFVFRKTKLICGADYSGDKISAIYLFNNANLKSYELIDLK